MMALAIVREMVPLRGHCARWSIILSLINGGKYLRASALILDTMSGTMVGSVVNLRMAPSADMMVGDASISPFHFLTKIEYT